MTVRLRDSRRITGAHLVMPGAGAIVDACGDRPQLRELIKAWEAEARRVLDAVGWQAEQTHARLLEGGASMAITAPIDALYAATEVNEWAFAAAGGETGDTEVTPVSGRPLGEVAAQLRSQIEAEQNPALRLLHDAAAERGVAFLSDDELVSVGLGMGSQTFPVDDLPAPEALDWAQIHDVPLALVTGTNGKTTTVRLVAQMLRHSGKTPGVTSTDHVMVGDTILDRGDYSGPGGARMVLRDPRVEVAVLESARGGMLRRGLAVSRADVAAVLNVAEDHLGEFGVADLSELADAKMTVARAVSSNGRLVVPAGDSLLAPRARQTGASCAWFSPDPEAGEAQGGAENAPCARAVAGRFELLHPGGRSVDLGAVAEAPVTFGGAAAHNVANALAAILVADGLGVAAEACRGGLAAFRSDAVSNPGRCNSFELGGIRAIVDFAHNPHGLRAAFDMARQLQARRRLVILGQAGDRDDDSIRELARTAWRSGPDHIVIKEMPEYLRGRELGVIPALIEEELRRLGLPDTSIQHAPSEMAAVRLALEWAQPGDLLLLLLHAQRERVLEFLGQLRETEWRTGVPLPS